MKTMTLPNGRCLVSETKCQVVSFVILLFLISTISCATTSGNKSNSTATPSVSNTTSSSNVLLPNVTLTTTEIVNTKNETLHTLAQNHYNLGPGGSPFGNSPLPPQLIAALQRRQQMLTQQNGGRPINPLQLLQGFLPGGPAALANLSPLQRQQLQQQFLRQQQLLQQNNLNNGLLRQQQGFNGAGRTPAVSNEDEGNANGASGDGGGGEDNEGQGQGEGEGNTNGGEQQENPQDDPDLKQLQRLQGGNNGDNFPADGGGSLFEGLFPPGILSAADIRDIEKGIEDQRKKEEEEKRQKEAEEQAAREEEERKEEEERQNQANQENNQENNQDNNNHNNNANHGGHSNTQPHLHGNHVHPPHGQQNQPHPNLNHQYQQPQQPYPQQGYPQVNGQAPGVAGYPVQPQITGYGQPQAPPPQLPYNPLQPQNPAAGAGLYPGQQQNQYPGQQFVPQGLPFAPGAGGAGIPGLTGVPGAAGIPGLGQLNPNLLSQVNPAILSQLNPALLQQLQRNQQLGGQGQQLANLNQLLQLNQLRNQQQQHNLNNHQPPVTPVGYNNPLTPPPPPSATPGYRPASLPQNTPSLLGGNNPDNHGYSNGRGNDYGRDTTGYDRPRDSYGRDTGRAQPNPPITTPYPLIGTLLRGAGRALGIPGLAGSGDDPIATTPSPRSTYRQRDPVPYEPNRDYTRPDDRRKPYSSGESAGGDYDERRSPYRENYHRQREKTPLHPIDYGRAREEFTRGDRDYGSNLRSGVDYRENDVDDDSRDRTASGTSGYRGGGYRDEEEKYPKAPDRDRIRFRDKVGEISYKNNIDHRSGNRRNPLSSFDDDEDHARSRRPVSWTG